MIIKQKSLIVALISSLVISLVLILTLISYLAYIEIKGEEFKRAYQEDLQKINARIYSRYIEAIKLSAGIDETGALRGKPVIDAQIKNNGYRDITGLLIKVKFLDRDGAVIYEVAFHPQEPALGTSGLTQVPIPYLSGPPKIILRPNETLAFKRILVNCPKEIVVALQEKSGFAKGIGRWAGKLALELMSVDF